MFALMFFPRRRCVTRLLTAQPEPSRHLLLRHVVLHTPRPRSATPRRYLPPPPPRHACLIDPRFSPAHILFAILMSGQ